MSNRNLLITALLILAVGAVAYAIGRQNTSTEPQGVLGNAAAAVSDKASQIGNEMEADADKASADKHMVAAKENLGIK